MQLEPVLAKWRETRDPQLSKLVVELGGEPDPEVADTYGAMKPVALVEKLCGELTAPDPERLSSLLPVVDRLVRTARGSWPVVELLADLPADPRFAYLAVRLLMDFGTLPHTSAKLWRRLLDAVEHHGDPSCIAPLAAVEPRDPNATTRARLTNIAKRLNKATNVSDGDLADLKTARVKASSNGDDLLAAVYADPASDDARTIYADWLTSQGDPRGEFIQLQLQRATGNLTAAGERRENALLKKHYKAWLGPLAPVISAAWYDPLFEPLPSELCVVSKSETSGRLSFSRGFVRRLPAMSVPKHRMTLFDDPIWSTVEHVTRIPKITPAMRALHSIELGTPEMVANRTFDYFGITVPYNPDVLAKCQIRHLRLCVSYDNAVHVTPVLAAATRDNPTLTQLTLTDGAPRNWERIWGLRELDLRHLAKITLHANPGRLELCPRDNTLTIVAENGDDQHWEWLLQPLADRAFASVTIAPGVSADDVERLARGYQLAPIIARS